MGPRSPVAIIATRPPTGERARDCRAIIRSSLVPSGGATRNRIALLVGTNTLLPRQAHVASPPKDTPATAAPPIQGRNALRGTLRGAAEWVVAIHSSSAFRSR